MGSTACCPWEGKGRGGGKQALEELEEESRCGGTLPTESNTETHMQMSLGERQGVVTVYLPGKEKNQNSARPS